MAWMDGLLPGRPGAAAAALATDKKNEADAEDMGQFCIPAALFAFVEQPPFQY